jgi:hypothetical protein
MLLVYIYICFVLFCFVDKTYHYILCYEETLPAESVLLIDVPSQIDSDIDSNSESDDKSEIDNNLKFVKLLLLLLF